jgi:hypothetical protein
VDDSSDSDISCSRGEMMDGDGHVKKNNVRISYHIRDEAVVVKTHKYQLLLDIHLSFSAKRIKSWALLQFLYEWRCMHLQNSTAMHPRLNRRYRSGAKY